MFVWILIQYVLENLQKSVRITLIRFHTEKFTRFNISPPKNNPTGGESPIEIQQHLTTNC